MIENGALLLGFVALNALAASSGAVFRPGDWYRALGKPPWTPPNWLFPLAWTILYAMSAYAGYRFTLDAAPGERIGPLILYGIQLALNAAWSALFFGAHRIGWALVDVVALAVAIAATALAFRASSPWAAALLIPYLLWVCFAAILNYSIFKRNGLSQRTG